MMFRYNKRSLKGTALLFIPSENNICLWVVLHSNFMNEFKIKFSVADVHNQFAFRLEKHSEIICNTYIKCKTNYDS